MSAVFLIACVALSVMPGPGVLFVVARTLAFGRRAGFVSVAGVALGNLGNAWAAALGLAAVLAASSLAFTVVRYAGAAYLVYLGVQALRARQDGTSGFDQRVPPPARVFREAALVALLNPKTAIFFAAFLPQFMDPAASAAVQGMALGAVFVAIAAVSDSVYVLAATAVASRLRPGDAARRIGRTATAALYIGLGAFAAASGTRNAR